MPGRSQVSRRVLLISATGALAGFIAGAVAQPGTQAVAATGFTANLTGSESSPSLRFYSAGWTALNTATVVQETVCAVSQVHSIVVTVVADGRIFAAAEKLILIESSSVRMIEAARVDLVGNTLTLTYHVSGLGERAGELRILTPLQSLVEYPNDHFDNAVNPTLSVLATYVDGSTGRESLPVWSLETVRGIAPFALTVAGAWATVSSNASENRVYRAPIAVRIMNEGPNPTPRGVTIFVASDPHVSGAPTVTRLDDGSEAALDVDPSEEREAGRDGMRETAITVPVLEPGRRMTLQLAWPAVVLPDTASNAREAAIIVRDNANPRQPNRTSERQYSVRDASLLQSLLPTVDIARTEAG